MTDDLSAPLGRKTPPPRKRGGQDSGKSGAGFRLGDLPFARLAFGAVALLLIGAGARILLVDDPMGGRPVAEIDVTSRNVNSIADSVSATPVTITAADEMPAGSTVIKVGDDLPDTSPAIGRDGLYPDLLEDTEYGPIPRISAGGERPFEAYARPGLTPGTAGGRKLIAIIVTGLGLNESGTATAIETLPETVTLAFAPYGRNLERTVAAARNAGHEVLLEMPLEPFDYPDSDPGPDTLLTGQAPRDNLQKLFAVMGKFGGYVGLINHMGARFTASAADFAPVMEELGSRGIGYLDDGSSNRSVAQQLAAANGVEFGRADMVLDANPSRAAILDRLGALEARATEKGAAIAVISALPISVQTIAEWAAGIDDDGFAIVPVSSLMKAGT